MPYVLIVDDERDSSEIIERFLTLKGYKTHSVPNGREALAALVAGSPDAVVLDVRMPGMDGISLLEILRSYLRWNHLPVILLTAHADKREIDQARELGVEHVFRKGSFTLPELYEAIEKSLPNRADG